MKTQSTVRPAGADSAERPTQTQNTLLVTRRRTVVSPKFIQESIPSNASGIYQIYGRRINLDALVDGGNTSVYSLMRAWVQDDPYRTTPHPFSHIADGSWNQTDSDDDMPIVRLDLSNERFYKSFEGLPSNVLSTIACTHENETIGPVVNDLKRRTKRRRLDAVSCFQRGQAIGRAMLMEKGLVVESTPVDQT